MVLKCKRCSTEHSKADVKEQLNLWGEFRMTLSQKGEVVCMEEVKVLCKECGNENFHVNS